MSNLENKLDNKKINLAKMAFYSQAFKNSTINSKIFPITNYIKINLKSNNIYQKKIKVKDYLYELNKRISKNNSLVKDKLFKNFKEKILSEFKVNCE